MLHCHITYSSKDIEAEGVYECAEEVTWRGPLARYLQLLPWGFAFWIIYKS